MQALTNWANKQIRKRQAFHSVHEALLGVNPFAYMIYRLRYYFIVTLVGLCAHIVEFSLLFHFLKKYSFISLISFKLIFTLVNGTWWGSLEIMRERIRRYYQAKKTREVGIEITLWVILGVALTVILILATLPISLHAWRDLAKGEFSLYDTYIVTILIQALCLIYTRTLHSGCLAIKRVYRPILSIISYEISSIIFILILLPWLHEYSLPVGVFLGSLLNIYFSVRYSLNMYRLLRIKPFRLPQKNHLIYRVKQLFSVELLCTSISSLMMQVESVIVIILLFSSLHHSHLAHVGVLIYFISPLIRASFDWVKLFYYDLKKYAHPLFRLMVAHLNLYIRRSSYVIAAVFWVISLALSLSFNLYDLPILLLLLPFFLLRSMLAHKQMHRFTQMYYLDVIASGVIAAFGIVLALLLQTSIYLLLGILSLFMLPALLYLTLFKTKVIETDSYHASELGFYQWLSLLNTEKKPLYYFALSFYKTKAAEKSRKFIEYVRTQFKNPPKCCRLNETTLFFYELMQEQEIKARQVFYNTLACGTLVSSTTKLCNNGQAATSTLLQTQLNTGEQTLATCPAAFKQLFPQGVILDLAAPHLNTLKIYTEEELSEIFYQIMHFIKWPLKKMIGFKFAVSVQLEQAQIRYVYITTKQKEIINDISRWQSAVHQHNTQALTKST